MTPDEQAAAVRAQHAAMYPKKPQKRRGQTPEAKVKAEVEKYLAKIGALSLRTGAGLITVGDRKFSVGRTGASDLTCCVAGAFVAIECKAERGQLSDLQRRYGERVTALGGLFVVARSRDDVRAALVARFGEEQVRGWEKAT